MKNKIYFILLGFLVLSGAIFYLPMNSLNLTSETARNGINDKDVEESIKENGQKTSSTPQLSQALAWEKNGTVISNEDKKEQNSPQICSDGAGGAIITWADLRNGNNYDLYAQKITSNGQTQWGNGSFWGDIPDRNGTIICNEDQESQSSAQICSDEAGGAIITWYDKRNGNNDIYAQKIASNGQTQWTVNGTVICNATANQEFPNICSDGAGGAIITWRDGRNGNLDIYAQWINSNGQTQWTANGTAICNATGIQWFPEICSDEAGGAIITWEDQRSGNDIYAQKIGSNGIPQWANGTVISNATQQQEMPQICSDEAGGAIITWTDKRNGGGFPDIYAQKMAPDGILKWTTNGTVISNKTLQIQDNPQICSDGAGGAIITWADKRNGINYDLYVQKITSNGQTQWGDGSSWGVLIDLNGTVICNEDKKEQNSPQICSDGAGGAIITWRDARNGNSDIYAQKINSNGQTKWMANGTAICNEDTDDQWSPQICSDEAGGAIITWEDFRNGGNNDIYAQKIKGVSGGGLALPSADDDDDDDEDTGFVVVMVFIIIIACVCGVVVVVIVLIKKGIIDTSKLKRG